jgi:hypothetical protein
MSSWDWGTQDEESPEQVEEALHRVAIESRKRKVRRQAIVGTTAAVLLVAAFVGGTQIAFDKADNDTVRLATQSEAPAPQDTVAPVPGSTPSTVAADVAATTRPTVLYAAKNSNDGKGRIVTINPENGKEIKTLASGSTMNDLSLSPDGKTLFFTEMDESTVPEEEKEWDRRGSLKSLPIGGGASTFYRYNAHAPKVSPNGKLVAYTEHGGSGVAGDVVVLDIASKQVTYRSNQIGTSRVNDHETGWVQSVVGWIDDNRVSAITNVFPQEAFDGRPAVPAKAVFSVFDVTLPDGNVFIDQALFTFPKTNDANYSGAMLKNGQLWVVENHFDGGAARMMLMDAKSGKILKTVATGYIGRQYGNPSADASGNHLIYMSANDVRVSDFGANPVVVATGVTSATW